MYEPSTRRPLSWQLQRDFASLNKKAPHAQALGNISPLRTPGDQWCQVLLQSIVNTSAIVPIMTDDIEVSTIVNLDVEVSGWRITFRSFCGGGKLTSGCPSSFRGGVLILMPSPDFLAIVSELPPSSMDEAVLTHGGGQQRC